MKGTRFYDDKVPKCHDDNNIKEAWEKLVELVIFTFENYFTRIGKMSSNINRKKYKIFLSKNNSNDLLLL